MPPGRQLAGNLQRPGDMLEQDLAVKGFGQITEHAPAGCLDRIRDRAMRRQDQHRQAGIAACAPD